MALDKQGDGLLSPEVCHQSSSLSRNASGAGGGHVPCRREQKRIEATPFEVTR